MCVILTDDLKPKVTKLMTVQVKSIIKNPPLSRTKAYMSVYDNVIDIKSFKYSEKRQLMIVPFPNENRMLAEFVQFEDRQTEEAMFDIAERLVPRTSFNQMKAATRSFTFTDNNLEADDRIEVQQVGGYKVSMALDYTDLSDKIQWDKFSLPINFDDLLRDMKLRFGKDHAFVIAEPARNRDSRFGGAFAWVYHTSRAGCLPTGHEKSQHSLVDYNVSGFSFASTPLRVRWGDGGARHVDISTKLDLNPTLANHLASILTSARFTKSKNARVEMVDSFTCGIRIDINKGIPINDNIYVHSVKTVGFNPTVQVKIIGQGSSGAVQSSNPAVNWWKRFAITLVIMLLVALVFVLVRQKGLPVITFKPIATVSDTVNSAVPIKFPELI